MSALSKKPIRSSLSSSLRLLGMPLMMSALLLALISGLLVQASWSLERSTESVIETVSWVQEAGNENEPAEDEQRAEESLGEDSHGNAQTDTQPVINAGKGYHARVVEFPKNGFTPIGHLENPDEHIMIEFTHQGAGISSIQLPDEFETVKYEKHVVLQQEVENAQTGFTAVPFSAVWVKIDGESVLISGTFTESVWSELEPGHFVAFVDDGEGRPVLKITRKFEIKPNDARGFTVEEHVENLSDEDLSVRLISTGPIDMPKAKSTYAGDRRRVRYGYLLDPERQGTSLKVQVDEELKSRNKLLGKKVVGEYGGKVYQGSLKVWPNEELLPNSTRLSWLTLSDRYFMVSVHPLLDLTETQTPDQRLLDGWSSIDRLILNPSANQLDAVFVLQFTGQEVQLAGQTSHTHEYGVYAGPRNRPLISQELDLAALNMPEMVVANLGGICAPCTFAWLTDVLIGVLRVFHSIVQDWAISIMLLVVLVRGCLHPVTRWSQIRVQRFSVQMQEMAPKQKAIREKYKDDPKKQQAEMGKLWREEGISPAGMLGCLPMFMQSPVWIALYATLFFASELRHEPAFYGIFQQMGGWGFMNDLAAPDGAIPLPSAMHFSFPMWGNVTSVNVLPLMLGFVMYAHQKFLTPPTQATLTPEQQQQQKMMKVMTIVLFPLMMYAAPSGLALYFITNSTIAVVENKWIRNHMKKHGMLEIENIRAEKKNKGPGFLQRMTEAAEAQRQIREKGPAQPNPASKNNRRGKL